MKKYPRRIRKALRIELKNARYLQQEKLELVEEYNKLLNAFQNVSKISNERRKENMHLAKENKELKIQLDKLNKPWYKKVFKRA